MRWNSKSDQTINEVNANTHILLSTSTIETNFDELRWVNWYCIRNSSHSNVSEIFMLRFSYWNVMVMARERWLYSNKTRSQLSKCNIKKWFWIALEQNYIKYSWNNFFHSSSIENFSFFGWCVKVLIEIP